MIEYRQIALQEREQARHVGWKAFGPDNPPPQPRTDPPQETEDRVVRFGAFDNGRLAATIYIEDRPTLIRGAELSFGGIAGVATLPEYRREHLVANLFTECFNYMSEADIVFSALAPFSFPFYEKFGYAHAAQMHSYQFSSRLLKAAKAPAGITMREYDPQSDLDGVMDVQRSMARYGSRVFEPRQYFEKPEKKHRYVFVREGILIGYVEYEFGMSEDQQSQIEVSRTWFSCDECLPALVDLTYRFASQVRMILWDIDPEIPLEYYILEPGQVKRSKHGYMMIRVVKFREFCQRIKVPLFASEPVIVKLSDHYCPWNEGVFKLTPVSGRLEIEVSDREPEISFDAVHLSHAIGGLLTANRLHRLGGLKCSADAAERFTRIFPPDSYVTYTGF